MADKYEKISKVGEGSFGVVWKVKNKQTGGIFAVKKIRIQSRDHGVSMAAIDEINALQVCLRVACPARRAMLSDARDTAPLASACMPYNNPTKT